LTRRCSRRAAGRSAWGDQGGGGCAPAVKRIGRPEELADAVLFLMKNGYVNGITLTVDGGGLLI
jgi:NAD(P)-dependent dehydrogenase (short-subunit alcohol dehydrogenase family)